jgi:hypothetical protein
MRCLSQACERDGCVPRCSADALGVGLMKWTPAVCAPMNTRGKEREREEEEEEEQCTDRQAERQRDRETHTYLDLFRNQSACRTCRRRTPSLGQLLLGQNVIHGFLTIVAYPMCLRQHARMSNSASHGGTAAADLWLVDQQVVRLPREAAALPMVPHVARPLTLYRLIAVGHDARAHWTH